MPHSVNLSETVASYCFVTRMAVKLFNYSQFTDGPLCLGVAATLKSP